MKSSSKTTLILGGSGKTGRRVARRLAALGLPARPASRSSEIPFDWYDERTWPRALEGARAAYVSYYPDLAIDGAAEHVGGFCRQAVDRGVEKIVLLAGRGEPQVALAEQAVRKSGAAFTILECAFFSQNFDEGWLAPVGEEIAFPGGDAAEPFIDCEDIADVAVAALTDDRHAGHTYELTGPRLLTFAEAVGELARASGRPLRYAAVSSEQYAQLLAPHLPPEQVRFFVELFRFLLDGHNAYVADGVERALGRKPRDFRAYARGAARAWRAEASAGAAQ
jgi:uncharacterized protein YbjT (DUF2867 family)